jgi:acylphosphatase
MQKCHSIIVTGKVQDMGFRSVVEHIGRSFGIPGFIFNAKDGSVKILCSGEDSVIDNFTHTIKIRGEESGAKIKGIKELLLPFNIDLPDDFSKVSSDDEIDIGRKLDKGNLLLTTMIIDNKTGFNNVNTGLTDIKTGLNDITTIMLEQNKHMMEHSQDQKEHNVRLEAHNTRLEAMQKEHGKDQKEHNTRLEAMQKEHGKDQKEHNTRLETILEKLIDK